MSLPAQRQAWYVPPTVISHWTGRHNQLSNLSRPDLIGFKSIDYILPLFCERINITCHLPGSGIVRKYMEKQCMPAGADAVEQM